MQTTTNIPTFEDMYRVISACAGSTRSVASAAMHLALPVDVCVGSDVFRDSGVWSFRGEVARIEEDSIEAAIEAAIDLAERTSRPTDKYLFLDDSPTNWVKVTSSGTLKVPFGLSILTGKTVSAPADTSSEDLDNAIAAAFRGLEIDPQFTELESLAEFATRMVSEGSK